jgi:hypothetical protein
MHTNILEIKEEFDMDHMIVRFYKNGKQTKVEPITIEESYKKYRDFLSSEDLRNIRNSLAIKENEYLKKQLQDYKAKLLDKDFISNSELSSSLVTEFHKKFSRIFPCDHPEFE